MKSIKKNILKIVIFSTILLFITSCTQINNIENYEQHSQVENKKISINDYFESNITKYKEINIKQETECLSGDCETEPFENKTYDKDCYFCNTSLLDIENKRLELQTDMYSRGFSDFFAGCDKKYNGPEMNGFDIIEITENKIVVEGKVKTYFKQQSSICNKTKDPECDDRTYGKCSGPDYEQIYIRDVQLVFEK